MTGITVREVVELLKDNKEIRLVYSSMSTPIDSDSEFDMSAYGDFIVSHVKALMEDIYEIYIASIPLKRGGEMA